MQAKQIKRKFNNLVLLFSSYSFGEALSIILRKIKFFLLKHILKKKEVMVKVRDYSMILNTHDEGISRDLYSLRRREEDHHAIITQELKNGDTVLDIGANIGYYVLMEAKIIGSKGKIFAVEPFLDNIELLRKNIALNHIENIVRVYDFAISNTGGEKEFFISKASNLGTLHPLVFSHKKKVDFVKSIKVKTVDIAEFLSQIGKVDLMRMDIEGHEVEVFEGLIKLGMDSKDKLPLKIIFETHFTKYDKFVHDIGKALRGMFDLGYQAKIISSNDEAITKIRTLGYLPFQVVKDGLGIFRGLYHNIRNEDLLKLLSELGTVRTVLLSR
jgi:FkbM family methyltransferase